MWAFVYHCCVLAGHGLPARHPKPVSRSFAAVQAWIEWARLPGNGFYFSARNPTLSPERGDVIVLDRLLDPAPHDHMGAVLAAGERGIQFAESSVNNLSAVVGRERNSHIRGFIRILETYRYDPASDGAPAHATPRKHMPSPSCLSPL